MSKLSDNINLAFLCIDEQFVGCITKAGWGDSIFIMEKLGMAICRVYWYYNNDDEYVCLDCLYVSEDLRGNGIGTRLQEIREDIGRKLGAKKSFLWVYKGTWMVEWYERRGYKYYSDREEEENTIWMVKNL